MAVLCVGLALAVGVCDAQQPAAAKAEPSSLAARVGDTGFIQLTSDSFAGLTPDQKMDAYWLIGRRSRWIRSPTTRIPPTGLREKHLLEAILTHPNGIDPAVLKKITEYTMLFWGNKGNHDANTSGKFLPDFTSAELRAAAEQASKNGATLGSATGLARELQELNKPIFDPEFQPMLIAEKSAERRRTSSEASSENFYSGVTLKDLVGFTEHYALNSRLDEAGRQAGGGRLSHRHAGWKGAAGTIRARTGAGDPRSAAGAAVRAAVSRQKVINDLIRYYQTGERADWIRMRHRLGAGQERIRIFRTVSSRSTRIRAGRRERFRDSSPSWTRK